MLPTLNHTFMLLSLFPHHMGISAGGWLGLLRLGASLHIGVHIHIAHLTGLHFAHTQFFYGVLVNHLYRDQGVQLTVRVLSLCASLIWRLILATS